MGVGVVGFPPVLANRSNFLPTSELLLNFGFPPLRCTECLYSRARLYFLLRVFFTLWSTLPHQPFPRLEMRHLTHMCPNPAPKRRLMSRNRELDINSAGRCSHHHVLVGPGEGRCQAGSRRLVPMRNGPYGKVRFSIFWGKRFPV